MSDSSEDKDFCEDDKKKIVYRVARMTRMLRNSMRELELDTGVIKASEMIPDAKERLNYVATLTEQAAVKTLSAAEEVRPFQGEIRQRSASLKQALENEESGSFKEQALADLDIIENNAAKSQKHLMDIVMAQGYQDLTGQVLKRLMDVIQELESELVSMLMEHVESSRAKEIKERMEGNAAPKDDKARYLNGPSIETEPVDDSVASQDDVDSLLDEFDL